MGVVLCVWQHCVLQRCMLYCVCALLHVLLLGVMLTLSSLFSPTHPPTPTSTQGSYCRSLGLINPDGLCHANHFCKRGSKTPNPTTGTSLILGLTIGGDECPAAHYCPNGTATPIPCPSGTYNPTEAASCKVCPQGFFCPEKTVTFGGNVCPLGHYCLPGTKEASQYACPKGKYGPKTGLHNVSHCAWSPGGKYTEAPGQTTFSGQCDPG